MRLINRQIPLAILLVAIAVTVGVYMAPSRKEIALMHMDDMDFTTALSKFSKLHDAGDHSINVLAPLINLNVYYGDIDQSIDLLKAFVAEHPKTVEGRKRLAELYKSSQRFNSYADTLEEIQILAPSADNLRELANTYDFLGRHKDEMSALSRLIETKNYRPVGEDYMRLAYFYHVDGQIDQAVDVLTGYIKDENYNVKPDAVFLAANLLLEQDSPNSARSLSTSFLKKHGQEIDAIILSSQFEAHGQYETAYDFLTPYLSHLDQSPELEKQVVSILQAQKKEEDAYKLLSEQNARNALPLVMTSSLLDLAVNRKDYAVIADVLKKVQIASLPEESLLRYASLSIQIKQPEIATIIHDRLDASYMHNSPLLKAVVDIGLQDSAENFYALQSVPEDMVVSTTSRIVVADIYLMHGMGKKAFNLLKGAPLADVLDMLDATDLATLYLGAGVPTEGEELLAKARPTSVPRVQDVIDRALVLLAAGMDKIDFVHQQLKNYEQKDVGFLEDGLEISSLYHHPNIGVEFAQRINKVVPGTKNRLQLASTLLTAGRFAEALQYLGAPKEKDANSRSLYIDAIDEMIEKAGVTRLPEDQKQAFQKLLLDAALNPALTTSERLEFGYLLQEVGLLPEAEKIFLAAVNEQPNDAHVVGELIGFWEDHPTPAARDWIEARAEAATGTERVTWVAALNEMGFAPTVLKLLRDDWYTTPELADQYIEAMVVTHDESLGDAISRAIRNEQNPRRLRQLAMIATEEDVNDEAESAWHKLHQIDPSDSEATLQLGMLAFESNRFDEAGPYLGQYLQHNEGNYHVNYAYGQILQETDRADDAIPYFERALKQLSVSADKNFEAMVDEATMQFHVGRIDESIAAFQRLVASNPHNKDLRAEFAELLMESGHYEEASRLLSQ